MKEKYDIVVVEWEDAQSSLENYELIDLLAIEPVMTCSCGYLINKNKDRITLSTMIFGGRIFKHHQTIPTKMSEIPLPKIFILRLWLLAS